MYIARGEPARDSETLRKRLGMFAREILDASRQQDLALILERELGIDVPRTGILGRNLEQFFRSAPIRYVLAAITLYYQYAQAKRLGDIAGKWRHFVLRTMREENVGYRIDDQCGVHPLIDQQFEADRVAVIAALRVPRYAAVLSAFDDAHRALEEEPPDGKLAVRHTFEAAEILFKLICDTSKVQVLGTEEVRDHFGPIVQRTYSSTPALAGAADRLVNSFKGWVSAAHPFRHGQKTEVPLTVPIELAVAMMSSGASFIRWLAELDPKNKGGS